MKNSLIFILLATTLIVTSCATQVPIAKNPNNGIIAIPMQAINRTGDSFSYSYKLISSFVPDVSVTIYPSVTKDFAFSKELPPGKYWFDKVKQILNKTNAINKSSTKPYSLKSSIIVEVRPGTISMTDQKLMLEKYIPEPEVYYTKSNFLKMSDDEISSYVAKLKNLENSGAWRIIAGN